jgi:hypothetical protein
MNGFKVVIYDKAIYHIDWSNPTNL